MCFSNNLNPIVISKDLYDDNWNLTRTPVIVIDRKFNKQITGFLPSYPSYVLPFESIDNLNMTIENLQRSTLWNIKSRFLILTTDSRCISTRRILEFMSKQDLLSVYYLCIKKKSTVVFTLNPYASYAPEPWALIEKFGENDKKMKLYNLQYSKNPEICKSIIFDKTGHLEGEIIKSVNILETKPPPIFNYRKSADSYLKSLLEHEIMCTLPYKISVLINATPTLDLIYTPNLTEYWKQGYIQQLVDHTHCIYHEMMDISNTKYEYEDIITDYSTEIQFSILTKKIDFLTVINDVTSDELFVAKTLVLLVMFAITMVFINRDDVRQALMDVMRLITSMGLESPLNQLAIKFIFFFGFIFAFLIVPEF
ncbi:uncharacterized protein LOC141534589 [Cotesia typhae]|uniref:uncharacterized protein LOC141534589 n=1 Tax=Cotesia typhae TaxID=2053667 RepID=UPI003D685A76